MRIEPLSHQHLVAFDSHFQRHRAESGRGEHHFMPFAPDDPVGPQGLDMPRLDLSCTTPGWQRWWVLINDEEEIVGHIDIKGDHLMSGIHHCELGIGLERNYRRQGWGRELMQTAIAFTKSVPTLAWLDLRVFAHNTGARALYKQLGFAEVGILPDRFRIDGERLDDVLMTLSVE